MDSKLVAAHLEQNPYAYMAVYGKTGFLCGGTVRSLSKLVDFASLTFLSFLSMTAADGSVEIEAVVEGL